MNQLFLSLGLATWKPLLVLLVLPPVPWLLLVLLGAAGLWRRRGWGWVLVLAGVALTWASCTTFVAEHTLRWLLSPPEALAESQVARLRDSAASGDRSTTIVVLGGGRSLAPEYDAVSLSAISLERLRYGIWLSRHTGLPVGFSGGLGPGFAGNTEAAIATEVAAQEFRHPLRWTEGASRDTGENASRTIALLAPQGVKRIVLVTHQAHMPRSLRAFERARAVAGVAVEVIPAPVGSRDGESPWDWADFLPGNHGWFTMRYAVREWIGILADA